jgi:hypothetical protein
MSRKIISTFTAAAMSMSIAMAVPVGVTAVSSLTVVPEAQAGWGKIKRVAKRKINKVKKRAIGVKDIVAGNRCKGGGWVAGNHGICGFTVDPVNTPIRVVKRKYKNLKNRIPNGRIGDLPNVHDHRQKSPSGVAISYNPLRWR